MLRLALALSLTATPSTTPPSVDSLTRQLLSLKGSDDRQSEALAEALEALGADSLETLIAASERASRDYYLGTFPSRVAAGMGPRVVPRLLDILAAEGRPESVRSFAEEGLTFVRPPPIQPLLRFAGRGAREQHIAARVLARIDDESGAAEKALLEIGPPAIEPLIEVGCEGRPARFKALTAFGPGSVSSIISALTRVLPRRLSCSPEALYDAVALMGPGIAPDLVAILNGAMPAGDLPATPDAERARFAAVFSARRILARSRPAPLESLESVLETAPLDGQQAAASLLAEFHDPRSFAALMACLRSEDELVREACAKGLGEIGDNRAEGPLLAVMFADRTTSASGAGYEAARALAKIYHPGIRDALLRCERGGCAPGSAVGARWALREGGDPIAMRLSERYSGVNLPPDPGTGLALILIVPVLLGGTGLIVAVLAAVGATCWPAAFPAAVVVSFIGVVWGASPDGLFGTLDGAVLLATAVILLLSRIIRTPAQADRKYAVRWLLLAAAFYGGYAVGWSWLLWG